MSSLEVVRRPAQSPMMWYIRSCAKEIGTSCATDPVVDLESLLAVTKCAIGCRERCPDSQVV